MKERHIDRVQAILQVEHTGEDEREMEACDAAPPPSPPPRGLVGVISRKSAEKWRREGRGCCAN
jgi:hypothetical protein